MSDRKKFKIQRALGIELPGLGKPGALEKRNSPPGQHGRLKKRSKSQFALQLMEKQKLLFHYGLREEQLRRFVRKARSLNTANWIESLIGLLERRLDNVVFRLGFARSISAARQLVSHGHVTVNGRRQTIGSMVLRPGEVVSLSERGLQMDVVQTSLRAPRLTMPSFLQYQNPSTPDRGVVLSIPGTAHVPFEFNSNQVAEYYAKRGV
ncbi:30S ribosomal protein S4 [Silvibacterium dinghuense]|uniref:Small ribosomal subunit protein uS4 n=1 Tax=Silvibacterium dinghuense TaxID=1560006 RepID=A0A4Q1SEC9_9BACT|nr:30S ribosomal protein S4 [Silvibacterium dinghuense]RXS95477.1 30S ribosomal protein S4 [Silvibacterium dinghuense]GGH13450.1 30S ribosomal protein S4 [Silvibacterium dinghuense]